MTIKNIIGAKDFLMCYWQAGGGIGAWLFERNGQLFLYAILNSPAGLQLTLKTWAYNDDRTQVDVVRHVFALLGFREVAVYKNFDAAQTSGIVKDLATDIEIYIKHAKERQEKLEQQQQKETQQQVTKDKGNSSKKGNVSPIK